MKRRCLLIICESTMWSLLNLNGHSVGIPSAGSFVVKDQLAHVTRGTGTHDGVIGVRRKGNAKPGSGRRIWANTSLAVEFQDRSRCDGYRACRGTNNATIANYGELCLYLHVHGTRLLASATDDHTLNAVADNRWIANSSCARAGLTTRRTG